MFGDISHTISSTYLGDKYRLYGTTVVVFMPVSVDRPKISAVVKAFLFESNASSKSSIDKFGSHPRQGRDFFLGSSFSYDLIGVHSILLYSTV